MDFFKQISNQFIQTSLLEWLAFLFGVLQVVLAWKKRTINFYAGILSVLLYTFVFYKVGLYAESFLNIYYFIISLAGLYLWNHQQNTHISFSNKKDYAIAISILLFSFIIQFIVLKKYTSSSVPLYDAIVASFAWAGSWLLIRKKIENWIWLNISNAIAIPLQWHKGLELTALLSCIYFIVAVLGFVEWKSENSRLKVQGFS